MSSVYRYALLVYVAGRWIYSLRDASYDEVIQESLNFTRYKIVTEPS